MNWVQQGECQLLDLSLFLHLIVLWISESKALAKFPELGQEKHCFLTQQQLCPPLPSAVHSQKPMYLVNEFAKYKALCVWADGMGTVAAYNSAAAETRMSSIKAPEL